MSYAFKICCLSDVADVAVSFVNIEKGSRQFVTCKKRLCQFVQFSLGQPAPIVVLHEADITALYRSFPKCAIGRISSSRSHEGPSTPWSRTYTPTKACPLAQRPPTLWPILRWQSNAWGWWHSQVWCPKPRAATHWSPHEATDEGSWAAHQLSITAEDNDDTVYVHVVSSLGGCVIVPLYCPCHLLQVKYMPKTFLALPLLLPRIAVNFSTYTFLFLYYFFAFFSQTISSSLRFLDHMTFWFSLSTPLHFHLLLYFYSLSLSFCYSPETPLQCWC